MPALRDPSAWPNRSFYAMGCHMRVWLAAEAPVAAKPLAQVEVLFGEAERRLSRFDVNSELSRVNARAGRWVGVSSLLWKVLAAALAMADETGGLFDPTVLPALETAGYARSFDQMQADLEYGAAAPINVQTHAAAWTGGRYRQVKRRRLARAIRLPLVSKLDFGGIAKGYVAQQAINYLRPWGGALIDAGGDLVAGDGPPGFRGWPIAVAAPEGFAYADSTDLAMLWLANGAIATSGVDYRTWQRQGRTLHHIIDPASGQPAATDLMAVTVLSPSAVQAEAWAKAALILGQQQGAAALTERRLAAVLVGRDGRVQTTPAMRPRLAGLD